jgi:hypothetical protein
MLSDPYKASMLHVETALYDILLFCSASHVGYRQQASTGRWYKGDTEGPPEHKSIEHADFIKTFKYSSLWGPLSPCENK